jgi:hypothetical protein
MPGEGCKSASVMALRRGSARNSAYRKGRGGGGGAAGTKFLITKFLTHKIPNHKKFLIVNNRH